MEIGAKWQAGNIGAHVKAVMDAGTTRIWTQLAHQLQEVDRVKALLEAALSGNCPVLGS